MGIPRKNESLESKDLRPFLFAVDLIYRHSHQKLQTSDSTGYSRPKLETSDSGGFNYILQYLVVAYIHFLRQSLSLPVVFHMQL